jgi:hypothetical protein
LLSADAASSSSQPHLSARDKFVGKSFWLRFCENRAWGTFSRSPARLPTALPGRLPSKKEGRGDARPVVRREFIQMHVITFDRKMARADWRLMWEASTGPATGGRPVFALGKSPDSDKVITAVLENHPILSAASSACR